MDIECPTCGEPWDSYYLRHDVAYEWDISEYERQVILDNGRFSGKNDPIREAARVAGWEFATDSLFSFTHCPCCQRRSSLMDAEARRQRATVAAGLLDGDDDALVSLLGD